MSEKSLSSSEQQPEGWWPRLKHILFGKPRDITEPNIFHRLSLIPILAWIGLGADGLSSSSYGPEEAFRALQGHTYMALGLAAMTALTVIIISISYSRIIEEFPSGGGGYLVASKLLSSRLGVLSGCALLVDYALTIAVSVVAAGDNIFSLFPVEWQPVRLPVTMLLIVLLTIVNIRGVRESVLMLAPIFILFIVTHAILIGVGVFEHIANFPMVATQATEGFARDSSILGIGAMLLIFARAFSLGGGTYTGIEAVSNGMPIMREPRVHTAKRTMMYMAISLSLTAGGLIVCYLFWGIAPEPGKTMNAILAQHVFESFPLADILVILTMFAAGSLLIVGAQTGFIGGPRVLTYMAVDSWVPRHFATLSERFTTVNGILVMGAASLVVVAYTRGNIHSLVVMYSINVFLTFLLSMLGMLRLWWSRKEVVHRKRRVTLFTVGFILCLTVLAVTVMEKFQEGGWLTITFTGLLVAVCFGIKRHYHSVSLQLQKFNEIIDELPLKEHATRQKEIKPKDSTAAILVSAYGGLGIHTLLNVFSKFPYQFNKVVFISVGVIDSGEMKGAEQIQALHDRTEEALQKYVKLAEQLGYPATYRMSLGADVIHEAFALCIEASKEFPRIMFFSGQLVFHEESWFHRLLHNTTAFSLQRHLFLAGQTMVVLPMRLTQ